MRGRTIAWMITVLVWLAAGTVAVVSAQEPSPTPVPGPSPSSLPSPSPLPTGSPRSPASIEVDGYQCTIVGDDGDDVLVGTNRRDVICGLGGDDVLTGRGGRDVLLGGTGHDELRGDGAGDVLKGGPGHDVLDGGAGVDLLFGAGGDDELFGGDREDFLDGGTGTDLVHGGPGPDLCKRGTLTSCYGGTINDARNRTGFDVRQVRTNPGSGRLRFTVVMRSRWNIRGKWDRGYVVLPLDVRGSRAPDLFALVRSTGGALRGDLFRVGRNQDRRLVKMGAQKQGRRVIFTVPRGKVRTLSTRHYIRWSVETLYLPRCATVCFDKVPGGTTMLVEPVP
jgi:hypothetical protein